MFISNLFPTPVYDAFVDNVDEIQRELQLVYDDLKSKNKFEKRKVWDTNIQKLSDPDFGNLLVEYNTEKFNNELAKHLFNFVRSISGKEITRTLKMVESWMTLTTKGEYSHLHSHPMNDYAGVYYFKTNGEDGSIYFESPVHTAEYVAYMDKHTERVIFKPKVGRLIIFPSYLKHAVFTNNTEEERVSVSFNLKFL